MRKARLRRALIFFRLISQDISSSQGFFGEEAGLADCIRQTRFFMTWSYWALAAVEAVAMDGIGGKEFEFAGSRAVQTDIVVPAAVVETAALAVGAGIAVDIVEAGTVDGIVG